VEMSSLIKLKHYVSKELLKLLVLTRKIGL
jgi:hypothetical protein